MRRAALVVIAQFLAIAGSAIPARAGNAPTYEAAVLSDGPVLYYPLDDGAPPMLNTSPALGPCQAVFNGAPNGGVTLHVAGYVQPRAVGFNGTDGVITILSPSACGPGFTPITTFTVESWFNAAPSFTAKGYFVTLFGTTSGIGLDAGHVFGLVNLQTPTSAVGATSAATFNDGHWHHAALTDDGVTLRLYVDGALHAQTFGLTGTLAFDAGTQGAIGSNGTSFFGGSLQDVAGYASALSATRVAAHNAAARTPVNRFPADFDGDGRTDVSVFRPSGGAWFSAPSAGGTGLATAYGVDTDVPVPADYDADGEADVAIFRPPTGLWAIHRSTDGADTFATYGVPGDVPVPADYDGDGRADIAVYRPSVGTWYVHRTFDNVDALTTYGGIPGDLAVPSDYDGDGKTDIAIFRAGTWFVHFAVGGVDTLLGYGADGDIPARSDYDGDGKTDIAIFRPSTGLWAVHNSAGGDVFLTYGGVTGDVPVPGDYDGDVRADVAIFRPSTGTWFVRRSTDGESTLTFGVPTDQPLPLAASLKG